MKLLTFFGFTQPRQYGRHIQQGRHMLYMLLLEGTIYTNMRKNNTKELITNNAQGQ